MEKSIILIIVMLLALPAVLAMNISVHNENPNLVLVKELKNPLSFNLSITNNGASDSFEIYNLIGFSMTPSQTIQIASGETKVINVTISPISDLHYNGYYTFTYSIENFEGSSVQESLTFTIVSLKDMFTINSSEINPESNYTTVSVKNNYNYNFKNLGVKLTSPFFTTYRNISLAPYATQSFKVPLNRTSFKSLLAGFYTISAQVIAENQAASTEGTIKFSQKNLVNVSESNSGFFVSKKVIEKTNTGNSVADSQTTVKKNIISGLFTTFSPDPDSKSRKGAEIYYTWTDKIQPGDTLKITVQTNWILLFFIAIFIAMVVILTRQLSRTDIKMDKKVSFLHAKGGEFAMKVTIVVNARRFVERLTISDRLPLLVKLYEKFGIEKPSRIDAKNHRIEWYFESLQSGETRVLTYVIYSKVGILGRFALPTATAIYEREGKILEAESNRAFMVAESSNKREN